MMKNNHSTAPEMLKANEAMDIWGIGATLYYFYTDKIPLFRFKQADDTLADEDEERRLVNWKGLSQQQLNLILPNCDDEKVKEKAK